MFPGDRTRGPQRPTPIDSEAAERSAGGKCLHLWSCQPHPTNHVGHVGESAIVPTFLDEPLRGWSTEGPYGPQPEPNRLRPTHRALIRNTFQRGVRQAGIDIRTTHDHPVTSCISHKRLWGIESHRLGTQ